MNDTKERLSETLESILENKPLSKITIVEVAEKCGVSRMSFYYHFKDLYDLVKWAFVRRARESVVMTSGEPSWKQGLYNVFQLMADNRNLVLNVYESVGHDRLYASACEVMKEYASRDFEQVAESMKLSSDSKRFIASFFVNAVIGMCFNWIGSGMDEDLIEPTVNKCHIAITASVVNVLQAFEQQEITAQD